MRPISEDVLCIISYKYFLTHSMVLSKCCLYLEKKEEKKTQRKTLMYSHTIGQKSL
jgi:hypothetical protein